ncbi:MAG TPA: hypothetical protein VF519_05120 [Mycobacteriales bacterium]|jgi:hypothetical protein
MKRLLLAGVAAAALGGTFAQPSNATIITCDNMPVMVSCYHWGPNGVEHCTVYVAGMGCVEDKIKLEVAS